MIKIDKKNLKIYFLLCITATSFILLFSKSTSPIYPNKYGYDAAIFMYVGKAMKYGYIPYKDLYDIKGPILFLLSF